MINVLFFIDTLSGGGAEKVLRTLVNNMDQDRFTITVETLWPVDNKKYLKDGVWYRSAYAKKNAFTYLLHRVEAALKLTYPLRVRGDYDIECAYLECGPTKIMAASTNKRAQKLCWVHCDLEKKMQDVPNFPPKATKWYRKFDKVICVSAEVQKSYVRLFGSEPEATVLYNTVDDAQIRKLAALPLPTPLTKRRLTVVSVGRLNKQKRFDRLLKAHKQLLYEGVDHDLWIVGEGSERTSLEAYIRENGLSDSVTLTGFQENPYPFMAAGDVLVCSSDYEGFSTALTEGLILGKAIVTTDCGGMKELLGDSEYGLITPCSDDGFVDGLSKMLNAQTLREGYREKALLRGSTFTTAALAAKTEEFFEAICQKEQKL